MCVCPSVYLSRSIFLSSDFKSTIQSVRSQLEVIRLVILLFSHLVEDADDGGPCIAPDEGHDGVLDDRDLGPVLRLEELHQHVHDLGEILDVLVLAQDGKVLNGL